MRRQAEITERNRFCPIRECKILIFGCGSREVWWIRGEVGTLVERSPLATLHPDENRKLRYFTEVLSTYVFGISRSCFATSSERC
jgi:hypothetical protein